MFELEDERLREKIEGLLAEQQKARETDALGAIEKHGVNTGRFAVNPFNRERVPIWVANYILADYGTGAIMSVPAHDERDFEFAQKYGLPVRRVIAPAVTGAEEPVLPYTAQDDCVVVGSGGGSGLECGAGNEKVGVVAKA